MSGNIKWLEEKQRVKEEQLSKLDVQIRSEIKMHEKWLKSNQQESRNLDLREMKIGAIELTDFHLDYAEFRDADLSGSKFIYTSLSHACMSGCNLKGVYFASNLEETGFSRIQGDNANFSTNNCKRAIFEYASLQKADFNTANLEGAEFCYANLRDANFYNANLSDVNFAFVNLNGANLIGARNLETVNFFGADLSGAKLCLSDISMEQLAQCKYTPKLAQMIQAKFYTMNHRVINTRTKEEKSRC